MIRFNRNFKNILSVSIIFFSLFFSACGQFSNNSTSGPIFTAWPDKITELKNPNFRAKLFNEAAALEPKLSQPGIQVHLGFWSGTGNRASLMRVLDSINSQNQPAIWDEGVDTSASNQYPAYIIMNREYWYERSSVTSDQLIIHGVPFMNINPVTFAQADETWGWYSKNYTDMAEIINQATGRPILAWCFVIGAKPNRIFYKYEYPELKILEQQGTVRIFFAKNSNADWQNPEDWTEGTDNNPPPSQ